MIFIYIYIFISYYRRRLVWTKTMNILLLREVITMDSFRGDSWKIVAENVNATFQAQDINVTVNTRQCSEHVDVLLNAFKKKNTTFRGKWVLFFAVIFLWIYLSVSRFKWDTSSLWIISMDLHVYFTNCVQSMYWHWFLTQSGLTTLQWKYNGWCCTLTWHTQSRGT